MEIREWFLHQTKKVYYIWQGTSIITQSVDNMLSFPDKCWNKKLLAVDILG